MPAPKKKKAKRYVRVNVIHLVALPIKKSSAYFFKKKKKTSSVSLKKSRTGSKSLNFHVVGAYGKILGTYPSSDAAQNKIANLSRQGIKAHISLTD